jgi:hypothetical protein
MNKLTAAAMAIVALGFVSTAASAQVVTSAGDLILGFQLAGSPTNYEVDLGAISQFTATATLDLSSDLKVSDLTSTYGANWADTTAGVNWGAAATNAGSGNSANNIVLTSQTKPAGLAKASLGVPAGVVNNYETQSGGISGATAAGTSKSALIGNAGAPANTINASWTSTFSNLQTLGDLQTTGASSIDLYQFNGGQFSGTTADLGTLKLSSTGGLTFTGVNAAAVPEPSAYALGICAVLLFVVLRRRATVA